MRNKFCGDCGVPLRPTEPQRRELTIVFCDIVDSMSLSQKLDPEELRAAMSEYRRMMGDIVARFDGHIAQWLGDGILAYFGYPRAHEDDPLRSVLCASEMIEAVRRFDPTLIHESSFHLRVRVGIHFGPVVVGAVGTAGRQEHLAEGETPNIAARIQAEAQPNSAVVSESVAKLLPGRVQLVELGPRSLKGVARRLTLFRVGDIAAARHGDEGATGATPYVGREEEIAFLADRWARARAGEAQAVAIIGSGGIGKSRLVEVFRQRIGPGTHVLRSQCSALHGSTPYYPILSLLREKLGFGPDDAPEDRLAKLERELALVVPDHAEGCDLLAPILSLPARDGALVATTSAQRRKRLTLELLRDWFLGRARAAPTVCVVEDLHWADPSTIELVHLIVESLESQKAATILLLLLYRPEQFAPSWAPSAGPAALTLGPLAPDETALMANRVVAGALPPDVVRDVIRRTEGVPLFIEELVRFFMDSGALQVAGKAYELVHSPPGEKLPSTLNTLLVARLDRLDAQAKEIAQLGAVVGREFSYVLLLALTSLDEPALLLALEALENARLVTRQGAPPDALYAFRHALIQQAAYDTLLRTKKQDSHRRIASLLEERFPDVEQSQPELLARHYAGAGTMHAERALHYWKKAAEQALARADNVEAITHLGKALQLVTSSEDSEARALAEFRLQLALAPAQMAIMGWPSKEVESTCLRALDLSKRLLAGNASEHAAEVGLGAAGSLWGIWSVHFLRGNMTEALARAEQVLQLAGRSGNRALEVMGHHAVGFTQYYAGAFSEAELHAQRGIATFDIDTERFIVHGFQFSSTVCLESFYASCLVNRGHFEDARRRMQSALDLVEGKLEGHPPSRAYLEAFGGYHWMFHRDFRRLAESSTLVRLLSQQEGFLFWLPFADAFDGILLSRQPDKLEAGIDLLRRGIEGMRASGSLLTAVELHPWLADRLIAAGREEEAVSLLDACIDDVVARGQYLAAPEHHRVRAEALGSLARKHRSAALLREALASDDRAQAVARGQGARLLELRAACTRVRLRAEGAGGGKEGAAGEAKALLRSVYETFSQGLESPDLCDAALLLDG